MKKWIVIVTLLALYSLRGITLNADSDYLSFETIDIENGQFLSSFTDEDYKTYYKEIKKSKFMGWNVYMVNKDCKVTYKTETIFSYYNDGMTPIEYNYAFETQEKSTRSISATGSIGISVSGTVKKFKGDLDSSLKITSTTSTENQSKETFNLKMQIDAGTMANLYITGEGKIDNGVASRYFFWLRIDRGGFEVFTVTTQYYRLEKVKI